MTSRIFAIEYIELIEGTEENFQRLGRRCFFVKPQIYGLQSGNTITAR